MISLRAFARSAPRSLSRLTAQAARPHFSLLRSSAIVNAPWRQAATARLTSAFSTSAWLRQSNEELLAKLQSEIDIEQSMRDSESYSNNIKEYIENSAFEVKDTPGQEEVLLTRQFGDETITVTFSIDDLANMEHDQEPDEYNDEALYDEEQDVSDIIGQQSGSANKGAINKGSAKGENVQVAPEDSVAPADREFEDEDMEDQRETSFAAHASIKIERPGKGALVLEAAAEDGEFKIESVMFFPNSEMAEPKNAEQWWERRSLYTGPQFGTLDEDLQLLLEKYLEERGINTRMALFIPDYIDYKEQKEYMRWLENVKSFVE